MTNLRFFAVSPSSPSTWSLGEFGRWLCGSTAGVVQGKENRGRDAQEETTGPILCSPQDKSEQPVNDTQPTTETRTTRRPRPLPPQAQRVRFGRPRTIPCGRPAGPEQQQLARLLDNLQLPCSLPMVSRPQPPRPPTHPLKAAGARRTVSYDSKKRVI